MAMRWRCPPDSSVGERQGGAAVYVEGNIVDCAEDLIFFLLHPPAGGEFLRKITGGNDDVCFVGVESFAVCGLVSGRQ